MDNLFYMLSYSTHYWHSAGNGRTVCFSSCPQAPLGGVPEQVLRGRWLHVQAVLLRSNYEGRGRLKCCHELHDN